MPVNAIASDSDLESNRPCTKSAGVTYERRCETDHSRGRKMKIIGYRMIVYGTAKKPIALPAYSSAGTAMKV